MESFKTELAEKVDGYLDYVVKEWMKENYENSLKTVSFLLHSDDGFAQAPYEEITKEQYEKRVSKLKQIANVQSGETLTELECAGGACPVK